MKIFLAGAGGTLGVPLLRQLVAEGHTVTAMTRSAAKRELLVSLGAQPVIVDALDAQAVRSAVAQAKPEVVVNLLTALPAAGPLRFKQLEATNRLRTEGAENLLQAAMDAGTRRIVAESFAAAVADVGTGDPLWPTVEALRSLEARHASMAATGRIEAVVLRYGLFYGLGVPSTRDLIHNLRMGRMAIPRQTPAKASWVHLQDAVMATIAAIHRPLRGGLYDVADDEPVTMREAIHTAATVLHLPAPRVVPGWLFRLLAPLPASFTKHALVLNNAAARRELDWQPAYPNQAIGYGTLAREWGMAA